MLLSVKISLTDQRNDHYRVEVCKGTVCSQCGVLPVTSPGEWSEAECGLEGDKVQITKRVATRFQLIEVNLYGLSE